MEVLCSTVRTCCDIFFSSPRHQRKWILCGECARTTNVQISFFLSLAATGGVIHRTLLLLLVIHHNEPVTEKRFPVVPYDACIWSVLLFHCFFFSPLPLTVTWIVRNYMHTKFVLILAYVGSFPAKCVHPAPLWVEKAQTNLDGEWLQARPQKGTVCQQACKLIDSELIGK